MGHDTAMRLIKAGNVHAQKIARKWRIEDPMWSNKIIRTQARSEELYILRENEAAAIIGIHKRNLRRYAEQGRIKTRKYGEGRGVRRYSIHDIQDFILARKHKKKSERKVPPGPRVFMVNWAKQQLGENQQ
jgi:hypothetical protein